jgi:hypothetical protein
MQGHSTFFFLRLDEIGIPIDANNAVTTLHVLISLSILRQREEWYLEELDIEENERFILKALRRT